MSEKIRQRKTKINLRKIYRENISFENKRTRQSEAQLGLLLGGGQYIILLGFEGGFPPLFRKFFKKKVLY